MLFTWNTENLCIVFSQWRVSGPLSLLLSLVGVALLTAGYELVRELSRKYEESSQEYSTRLPRKSHLRCYCPIASLKPSAPMLLVDSGHLRGCP